MLGVLECGRCAAALSGHFNGPSSTNVHPSLVVTVCRASRARGSTHCCTCSCPHCKSLWYAQPSGEVSSFSVKQSRCWSRALNCASDTPQASPVHGRCHAPISGQSSAPLQARANAASSPAALRAADRLTAQPAAGEASGYQILALYPLGPDPSGETRI